jgi:hypothetical protein
MIAARLLINRAIPSNVDHDALLITSVGWEFCA